MRPPRALGIIPFLWTMLAAAPPATAAGDSVCVLFLGSGRGETIGLSRGYRLNGMLPVTFCGIEPRVGYRLTLGGAGLERRIGTFSVGRSGAGEVGGIRLGAMGRNGLVPGWGSMRAERPVTGTVDAASIGATLVILYQEEREYRHLRNRFDMLSSLIADADSYEEKARLQEAAHTASRETNIQNRHRRRLAILGGALYGWQVLEPLLVDLPPGSRPGGSSGSISLAGSPSSRAKAFFYSLVHPGRGQFYQGKTVRGLVFSTAAVGAGLFALELQNRLEETVGAYDVCVERFQAAATVPEKEALAARCSLLEDEAMGRRRDRNISLAVLGGLWAWNLADTFFEPDAIDTGGRFSLEPDVRGPAVAVRF